MEIKLIEPETTALATPKEMANSLAQRLGADIVQIIGNIFILYKKSTRKDFKHIQLP